jgi:2-polyprenyl-3-methyl-5-hydroxy-6-metoxy-1,4-benzoquinol methylase
MNNRIERRKRQLREKNSIVESTEFSINNYNDLLKNYFYIVNGQKVLEIAPANGKHSKIIIDQLPKELTVVDADVNLEETLKAIQGITHVIIDDVFNYLNTNRYFDVVLCNGFLYHTHSPFYLFELIANRVKPKYIILESIISDKISVNEEIENVAGQRITANDWKSCKINTIYPIAYYSCAMTNLGYSMVKQDTFSVNKNHPTRKDNIWIQLWQLN